MMSLHGPCSLETTGQWRLLSAASPGRTDQFGCIRHPSSEERRRRQKQLPGGPFAEPRQHAVRVGCVS